MSFSSKIIRDIYILIPKNSRVIEIGCGKGKLLKELSEKIEYGLGIDINKRKINFANKNSKSNLEFKVNDAKELNNFKKKFDYAISMFTIHSVDYETQIKTLKNMSKSAEKVILIDYLWPKNLFYKALIFFDEILAGHYKNFLDYKKRGGIKDLISDTGLKINKEIKGHNEFYNIWVCS